MHILISSICVSYLLSSPDVGCFQRTTPHCCDRDQEADSDAESHVNYLITLFQVLKSSGVRQESFLNAFRLLGLVPKLKGKLNSAIRYSLTLTVIGGMYDQCHG